MNSDLETVTVVVEGELSLDMHLTGGSVKSNVRELETYENLRNLEPELSDLNFPSIVTRIDKAYLCNDFLETPIAIDKIGRSSKESRTISNTLTKISPLIQGSFFGFIVVTFINLEINLSLLDSIVATILSLLLASLAYLTLKGFIPIPSIFVSYPKVDQNQDTQFVFLVKGKGLIIFTFNNVSQEIAEENVKWILGIGVPNIDRVIEVDYSITIDMLRSINLYGPDRNTLFSGNLISPVRRLLVHSRTSLHLITLYGFLCGIFLTFHIFTNPAS